eukprot:s3551_g5.t1
MQSAQSHFHGDKTDKSYAATPFLAIFLCTLHATSVLPEIRIRCTLQHVPLAYAQMSRKIVFKNKGLSEFLV